MRTGAACTPDPVTVGLDAPVVHAADLMRLHQIGDVVVVDGRSPVGILTDRDIALGVAQAADRLTSLVVRDLLVAADVFVAEADDPMWKTLKRMRDHGIRRMPVVESGRLVGIFTVDDAIGLVVEQLDDIASLIGAQIAR